MPRLNLNLKNNLGETLVLQYQGEVQSSFTMSSLNLNYKIECKVIFWSAVPGWSSFIFHHVQAKSELYKNIRWVSWSAVPGWRSIIFLHVQAKSEYKNLRWYFGLKYLGWSQSSFTMSRLNLNVKELDELLFCSTWVEVNHLLLFQG